MNIWNFACRGFSNVSERSANISRVFDINLANGDLSLLTSKKGARWLPIRLLHDLCSRHFLTSLQSEVAARSRSRAPELPPQRSRRMRSWSLLADAAAMAVLHPIGWDTRVAGSTETGGACRSVDDAPRSSPHALPEALLRRACQSGQADVLLRICRRSGDLCMFRAMVCCNFGIAGRPLGTEPLYITGRMEVGTATAQGTVGNMPRRNAEADMPPA